MVKIPIKLKLLNADAKVPVYTSDEAAGFDVYSNQEIILEPGKPTLVFSGIAIEIPKDYCVQFWDRSGLGAKGIHHFAGLIDSDYRGELKVVLFNSTKEPYKIEKGDRIVQGVLVPIFHGDFQVVDELNESKRGAGGFHSSGKK